MRITKLAFKQFHSRYKLKSIFSINIMTTFKQMYVITNYFYKFKDDINLKFMTDRSLEELLPPISCSNLKMSFFRDVIDNIVIFLRI